jgi:hypothetical protein
VKVFLVDRQVFGKISDSPGKESDLYLRRAGVGVMKPMLPNDLLLVCNRFGHEAITPFLLMKIPASSTYDIICP